MGVTIKDVAKAAGVSVSTVSKVINGHYSISEGTVLRVRRIMQEMNYYPSASAQNFAKGSTQKVVLLTNLEKNIAFKNSHMFEIIAGVENSLRRKGYALELRGTDMTDACEVAEDIISRRSADALVVHVSVMSHALSALLVSRHFPHMVLGVPNFESQACWVDINNIYSGTLAAGHLIAQGYRRIAFIGGREYDLNSTQRLQGMRQGLLDAGFPLQEHYIWLGESTWEEGLHMTRKLLSQKPLPDAIVCANNYIAMGCVSALKEMELKIPEDMAVMTFDDYPFAQMMDPKLTVVDIDVRDMGLQAGRLLLDVIRNPNMQVQTYITPSNLIVRQSTRAKTGKGYHFKK